MRRKRYNYFDDDEDVISQIRQRAKEQSAQQDYIFDLPKPPQVPDLPAPQPALSDRSDSNDLPQPESEESHTHHNDSPLHSAAAEAIALAAKTKEAAIHVASVGMERFAEEESKAPRRVAALLSLFVIFVMIVSTVSVVSHKINSNADMDHSFNTSAGEICNQYATKYGNCNYESLGQYGIQGYRLTGVCCVRQIDFDGDGTGELLICYKDRNTYYAEVWGFHGKKFDMLYKDKICQTKDKKDDVWITLYYHNGKYSIGKHSQKDVSQVALYSLKHHKFVQTDICTYDPVADAFTVDKKVNLDDFERIKMSVMRESAAYIASDNANTAIENMMVEQNEGKPIQKKKNNKNSAYYSVVKSLNERYGVAKFHTNPGRAYASGLAVVRLLDFDNDGTEELLTIYRRAVNEMGEDTDGNYKSESTYKYCVAIYTWNGKIATQVYSSEDLSNCMTNDVNRYYVLQRDGKKLNWCSNHFVVQDYGRNVEATSKILSFNSTSFDQEMKAYYSTNYGYTEYYLNDQWASKSKFTDNGGFSVPFFDGESYYDQEKYIIEYVQTKAANQNAIKSVVERTEDTIKTLDNTYNPEDVVSVAEEE